MASYTPGLSAFRTMGRVHKNVEKYGFLPWEGGGWGGGVGGGGAGGGIEVAAKDHTFSLLSIPFQSITYYNENPTNIYILRHLLLPRLSWLSSIPTSY